MNTSRLWWALASYALSSVGFLGAMFLLVTQWFVGTPEIFCVGALVWGYAWLVHIRMAVAWVRDRRLHRSWPVFGVVLGLGGIALYPVVVWGTAEISATVYWDAVTIPAVFVAPCIVLGAWLVRFHWTPSGSGIAAGHS
ncbi:hypothetical protein M5C99_14565 [Acidovorax sp. NCPPB 2350]|nr:hypothetical protein M5C99_14565 [Acidovorax sp. NCPPB 2350]